MRVEKMKVLWAITAFLAMGSLCFADIEPEVTEVVVEPNDPDWTPSDCFVPAWERVTLSAVAVISNPDEVNDAAGYETTRTLSISCNLYKADIRNLISSATFLRPDEARAVDDQNNVYTYENPSTLLQIDTTQLPSSIADRPVNISLSFPMDPNVGFPTWLSEVSWSIKGLFAHAIRTVKVPFQASDQWIELLPGYSIMIEEAVLKENSYSYRIKGRYEGMDSPPRSFIFLRDDEPLPQYMDMGMTLLDANGIDVRSYSRSNSGLSSSSTTPSLKELTLGENDSDSSSGNNSNYNSIMAGMGSCSACGGVKTIQFKFAVDPYIADMFYVLNDITVPTL